jgi:parallel beta-helix repeat protein
MSSTYKVDNLQSGTTIQDETDTTKKIKFNLANISSGNTRDITIPDASFEMVGKTTNQEVENKTVDGSKNTLSNIGNSALSTGIDAAKIANGSVSNAEFQRLANLTSDAMGLNDVQTVTNKTFVDSSTIFEDNVDSNKKGQFDLTGVTSGQIRKYDLPDADTRLIGHNNVETLTQKTIDADSNTLSNIDDGNIKSGAAINAAKMADGSVNNAKFQYLKNVASDIQAQIDSHTHVPSEVGLSNVPNLKMNLSATNAPGINNDSSTGYSVGSRWVDIFAKEEYVCTDASDGAANWELTTAVGGGGEGGEANTMANVGSTGIGLYIDKTGVQFRLKNIETTSSRLTVTDNTNQDTIDLDVVESGININNLSGAPTGNVMGDSDAQTLTNKTIAAGSNTITGLTNSDVGLSNVPNLKVNLTATSDPGVNDDSSAGYAVGSRWANTSTDNEFVCLDNSIGVAIWKNATSNLVYDAIVDINGAGNYTSVVAAFNAGHITVFVKKGTYVESADIVIPEGGNLIGETSGLTNIVFTGNYSVRVDGSSGTKESIGTISFTTDSTTVTGLGTTFTNLSPGDYILLNQAFHPIGSITSDTSLELDHAYQGQSMTNVTYIAQTMRVGVFIKSIGIMSSTGIGLYMRACRCCVVKSVMIQSCATNIQLLDSCANYIESIKSYNATIYGMRFTDVFSNTISGCEVFNAGSTGVLIDGSSERLKITGISSNNNGADGINFTNTVHDIYVMGGVFSHNDGKGTNTDTTTSAIIVNNCIFDGNGTDGLNFDGTQNMVTNSVFKNNGQYGIQAGNESIINNNHMESNISHGIYLSGDHRSTVTGNRIENNTGCGIYSDSVYCTIIGNYVGDNNNQGIYLTGATDCSVSGNEIYNNTDEGIYAVTAARTIATSNQIYSNSIGIRIDSNSSDCVITSNLSDSNDSHGIQVDGDNCIVNNNRCVSNTGNGLLISATANNVMHNNNNLNGNTGSNISDSGTVDSNLPPVLANEFDARSATILTVGRSTATKVELADTGVTTEVKGPLSVLEGATGISKSDVGLGNVENLKMNLVATTDPTSLDDSSTGYAIGSRWVNTDTNKEYVCTDASIGLANWEHTTVTAGPAWYGSSATDPAGSFNSGDEYFNTVLGQKMFYDGTRSKWLSVSLCFEGMGKRGNTPQNTFYDRFDGMALGTTTGPYIPKGTIVAISYGTDNAVSHTCEVLIDGSVVASLASGGATTAHDNTINADYNGGKYAARNGNGGSTTNDFQGTICYRLRA